MHSFETCYKTMVSIAIYTLVSILARHSCTTTFIIEIIARICRLVLVITIACRILFCTHVVEPQTLPGFSDFLNLYCVSYAFHPIPVCLEAAKRTVLKVKRKNRSTEGCSKLKSQETRQAQEILVSTSEHLQAPKWDRTRRPEEQAPSAGMPHPLQMFYGNLSQLGKKSNSVIRSNVLINLVPGLGV